MSVPQPSLCVVLIGALLASAPAQDLIGVGYGGQTYLVNSYTGAVTSFGTGLFGMNATARDASGTIWTTHRVTPTGNNYSWATLDPITGSATIAYPGADIRCLAKGPGNTLYAIQEVAFADWLVSFDPNTGTVTPIGNTGYGAVQGLAMHQGVLYGWELFSGLVVIDPATGTATDPFPGVLGPTYPQAMCSHPDGRLLLGGGTNNTLYELDVATGLATTIAVTTGAADLRGLEPLGTSAVEVFGQGCDGAYGPANLVVSSSPVAGGQILTVSGNHAANSIGAVCFGLSNTTHLGLSLPLPLDPLLGTSGCSLLVSLDLAVIGLTNSTTPSELSYALAIGPGTSGAVVYVQHACFEPVAGGMSWSNAVSVTVQ